MPEKKKSDADRRLRQADRMARVLRVLQLIQSRGRWNATTIAQELECSERTVYRDLQVLNSRTGGPIGALIGNGRRRARGEPASLLVM